MARVSSASLYGSGTPTDLARLNWNRPPRAYGLRSQSTISGYYPAYGERPRRRTVRERIDPSTNLVAPVATVDEDYVPPRVVTPRLGDGTVKPIRMGEWNW